MNSYADAAGGNKLKKVTVEWILFVQVDDEGERVMIQKDAWLLCLDKVNGSVMDMQLKGESAPTVQWTGYKNGVGILACDNKESREALRKLVADTQVAEFKLTAYGRGETGKYHHVSVKVPGVLQRHPPQKILQAMQIYNKLPASYKYRATSALQGGTRVLRILAEEDFVKAITKIPVVKVGLEEVKVRVPDSFLQSSK